MTPISITYNRDKEQTLGSNPIAVFDDIVKICKEKNIVLVLYTAPIEGPYPYASFFEEYAAENGCYYVNFMDNIKEADINPETDFSDGDHLNNTGAVKAADFLGNFLLENDLILK